jgi:hypothetical protein
MRECTVIVPDADDLPMVVGRSLMNMGSLAANQCTWAILLKALGFSNGLRYYHSLPYVDLAVAAQRLIDNAREAHGVHSAAGDIADSATIAYVTNGVQFLTPRGVRVTITRSEAGCEIHLNFGRDSVRLATNVLAMFFRFGVPGTARLLATVATEAALAEEAVAA